MFPKPAECSIAETWTGWSEIMNGEGGFNIYLDGSQGSPRIYEYIDSRRNLFNLSM